MHYNIMLTPTNRASLVINHEAPRWCSCMPCLTGPQHICRLSHAAMQAGSLSGAAHLAVSLQLLLIRQKP